MWEAIITRVGRPSAGPADAAVAAAERERAVFFFAAFARVADALVASVDQVAAERVVT
ncbi:MAG: hypothetical protein R3E97_14315 [Candidatus Eisenbacteria bacterium]